MPVQLVNVLEAAERRWPAAGAEAWDASGLIIGSPTAEVSRVLFCVDVTAATVAEAVELSADLLIAHHPLLLRGVTTVAENTYKGILITNLIRANCALLAAHTNADVVATGTSAVIAQKLGLLNTKPIVSAGDGTHGLGRVGVLSEPTTLGRLARKLVAILPATAFGVLGAGSYDQPISNVAVCAGAGDSLLNHPTVRSADVYITADLRHHPASEAREQALISSGPALLEVSHWASEWLWLEQAAAELRNDFPDIAVEVSELRTDPWDFQVMK